MIVPLLKFNEKKLEYENRHQYFLKNLISVKNKLNNEINPQV